MQLKSDLLDNQMSTDALNTSTKLKLMHKIMDTLLNKLFQITVVILMAV